MKKIIFTVLVCISLPLHATRYALISVSDKTGVQEFARTLVANGYEVISTGGTYTHLAQVLPSDRLHQVSDMTEFPEILGGRVKTLHPRIHGGILAQRSLKAHDQTLKEHSIPRIDIVVGNLYPFQNVIKGDNVSLDNALENIDIGGVALARAAAKNYKDVLVVTDPSDYDTVAKLLEQSTISDEIRKRLAVKAFAHTAQYDGAISEYLSQGSIVTRQYHKAQSLKYGLNPHQKDAALYTMQRENSPVRLLNGQLGFINVLDALQSWQLVREAKEAFGVPACASFKHVSPAGVGLGIPLTNEQAHAFHVNAEQSPIACAFIRARNGDPKSSFGDWIAISDVVDEQTARLIKPEVSDGIIAPGFTPEALEILKQKKRGAYALVQIDPEYSNEQFLEMRELFGLALAQQPNRAVITGESTRNIVTKKRSLSTAERDAQLALIALKYTQSNSVVYAKDGQVIGVGSGQQNRVDCVRLAGKKAAFWMLRQHPRVQALQFKASVKRPERNNAIEQFIKGKSIDDLLLEAQEPLTRKQKETYLQSQRGISMASDAFFPFEDNIEAAAQCGVEYIVQPGGSMRDAQIIAACDAREIVMACNGVRLFTH